MARALTNRILFLLALAGVQVAGYLTLAHLHLLNLVCGRLHGCETVARHPTAHGLGIPALSAVPTAMFGLLFFCLVALLCGLRALYPPPRWSRGIGYTLWGCSVFGLFLSGWLTYLEAAVIHAWCIWCLCSAGIVLCLFLILSAEQLSERRPRISGSLLEGRAGSVDRSTISGYAVVLLVVAMFDGLGFWALRQGMSPLQRPVTAAPVRQSALLPPWSHRRGDPTAPYTLVEFGDYNCSSCQDTMPLVEKILAQHPHSLQFAFDYYPATERELLDPLAPRAVEAAAQQGAYWPMHAALFAATRAQLDAEVDITLSHALAMAGKLGLDTERFRRDLASPAVRQAITRQMTLGDRLKIDEAPTFFLLLPSGNTLRLVGPEELRRWIAANALPE